MSSFSSYEILFFSLLLYAVSSYVLLSVDCLVVEASLILLYSELISCSYRSSDKIRFLFTSYCVRTSVCSLKMCVSCLWIFYCKDEISSLFCVWYIKSLSVLIVECLPTDNRASKISFSFCVNCPNSSSFFSLYNAIDWRRLLSSSALILKSTILVS